MLDFNFYFFLPMTQTCIRLCITCIKSQPCPSVIIQYTSLIREDRHTIRAPPFISMCWEGIRELTHYAPVQHSQDLDQPLNCHIRKQSNAWTWACTKSVEPLAAVGSMPHKNCNVHQQANGNLYAHTGSSVLWNLQVKLLALLPGRGVKDKYDSSFLS